MHPSRGLAASLPLVLLFLALLAAGCDQDVGMQPDDDDSGAEEDDVGDDDTVAGDDDTVAGDDDTVAGDDDTVAGDDDTVAGDDDTVAGDDDTVAGDDDSEAGDDDTGGSAVCPSWSFDGDAAGWTLANGLSLAASQEAGSVTCSC